jgi:hypothetical protein
VAVAMVVGSLSAPPSSAAPAAEEYAGAR